VRGWINYYGRFYRSELASTVLQQINEYLIRWAMWKYKGCGSSRVTLSCALTVLP
jgi:hypothetical protein